MSFIVHSLAFGMFWLVQWWSNVTQSKSSMFAQIGPKILESFQIPIDWKRIKTKSLLVQMRKNYAQGFSGLSKMCNTKINMYQNGHVQEGKNFLDLLFRYEVSLKKIV